MNLLDTSARWYIWDRRLCPTLDTIPFDIREVPVRLSRFDLGMGDSILQVGPIDRCLYAMEFGIL